MRIKVVGLFSGKYTPFSEFRESNEVNMSIKTLYIRDANHLMHHGVLACSKPKRCVCSSRRNVK